MAELKTLNLKGIEIFSAGTWTDSAGKTNTWTEADLDEMVESFAALKGQVDPPAKLGHDDDQALIQREGWPAAGWISNLYREGSKLVADIARVPATFADLITAGGYRKVSSEIFRSLKVGDTVYRNVLGAVAFLGEELPAVKDLKDFIALYRQDPRLSFNADQDPARVDYPINHSERPRPRAAEEEASMQQQHFRDLVGRLGRAILGPTADHTLGADESLEQRQRLLQAAIDEAFPSGGEYGWPWIVASFDDHVVINRGESYWDVPYGVATDGAITLGQASEVEQTWTPKQRDTTTDAGQSGAEEAVMATPKAVLNALGLPEGTDDAAVVSAITGLRGEQAKHSELPERVSKLEHENAELRATTVVDRAIRDRKLAPAKKDWAVKFAAADPDGFADWVKDAPELFRSGERGSATDAPETQRAGDQINRLITDALKADPKLSFAEAMSTVTREHPELVSQYREESRAVAARS